MSKNYAFLPCTLILSCAFIASIALADSAYETYGLESNGNSYLDDYDKIALSDLKNRRQRGRDGMGLNGSVVSPHEVVFSFGASAPSIVCAILHLTDIQFEPGENINSVQLGDSARWSVDASTSGSFQGPIAHLILKPLDIDLETSMVITTDRRTYHLNIKSTMDEYMPAVRFVYPKDNINNLNFAYKDRSVSQMPNDLPQSATNTQKNYSSLPPTRQRRYEFECEGDDEIMPLAVFHNGKQTFIQMDRKTLQQGAPALVLLSKESLFSKQNISVINYRLIGTTYIVDGVFNKARLMHSNFGKNYSVDINFKG